MGTCANALRSSGEGAAAICQANQKIKKIVLQTGGGRVPRRVQGWPQLRAEPWVLSAPRGVLAVLAWEQRQGGICSPSVLKSPLPKSAFIPRARKGN